MKNLNLFFAVILVCTVASIGYAQGLKVGDEAAAFKLKNVDGKMISLADYKDKEGVVVVFTCNHCPYAKAYEDRLVALQGRHHADFPVIAINPNDAVEYPSDNYVAMVERAKEKSFNFPYLHDESQAIAKAYGATKTPHVYLLQNVKGKFQVAYIGAIDDNYQDESKVKKTYLEDAIDTIKKGGSPSPSETKAIGCSVKWKS